MTFWKSVWQLADCAWAAPPEAKSAVATAKAAFMDRDFGNIIVRACRLKAER